MKIGNGELICGDCLEEMKKLPDDSVDLIVTDPPYGYSFMNKAWDKGVPKVEIWKECLRVLKPGAFAFIMSAPRQDVQGQMITNLHAAKFELAFTPIYWAYASGFPKAMNISKAVDKKLGVERERINNPTPLNKNKDVLKYGYTDQAISDQAKALDGSYAGYQPKPAVEIILVAMKPLSEKTYVDQAMKNQKGITWLDDCRVPYESEKDALEVDFNRRGTSERSSKKEGDSMNIHDGGWKAQKKLPPLPTGRFPANLIVSDDVLNDGKITESKRQVVSNKGSIWGSGNEAEGERGHNDSGSFSRYFSLDAWASRLPKNVQKTYPFLIVPKASSGEKNDNMESWDDKTVTDRRQTPIDNAFQRGKTKKKNVHPTVKPTKLMQYLITLGSRENDIVLDPFLGSGTTGLACEQLARKWIGIELNPEYVEITKARLSEWKGQTRL